MAELRSKLPLSGTTIFSSISALAVKHKAINLGQGFPDYEMDGELIELVNEAMKNNHNQYAPMPGYLPLLEAISEKVFDLYNCTILNDEITITPGGTYAIYTALTAILQPLDEVIMFEPAYDSYIPNIELNGARAIKLSLKQPGFYIDWQEVEQHINAKTKAIIINSPHNPTGEILSANDLKILESLVIKYNLYLISDEVYEHLIYDGLVHQSVLKFPALYKRSFICFSFGKTYNCTGWKLGYCIAPANLTAEFRKIHQYNCFSCFTPTQVALSVFIKNKSAYLNLANMMQKKRDYFLNLMQNSRFDFLPSHGTYFICARYNRINHLPDRVFIENLIAQHGVAAIPVSSFYADGQDDGLIRFCFSKKEETLFNAAQKLCAI